MDEHSRTGRRSCDVFTIIGDPTKRRILELTRDREWCVNELVENLGLSQPAISKHLRSLREAHLVTVRVDGQRRWYRLIPEEMRPLKEWVSAFPPMLGGGHSVSDEAIDALNKDGTQAALVR